MKIISGKRFNTLTKILIAMVGILLSFFIIIFIFIQLLANYFVNEHVNKNVYVQHEKVDLFVSTLTFDTLKILLEVISNENIIAIEESNDRQEKFLEIVDRLMINPGIYEGVSLFIKEESFYSNDLIAIINDEHLEIAELGIGKIVYCGSEYTRKNNELIFGIHDSGNTAFIHINEKVILDGLSGVVSSGVTFIVKDLNYIVAHPIKNYAGGIFIEDNLFSNKEKSYTVKNYQKVKSVIIASKLQDANDRYNLNWTIVTIQSYDGLFQQIKALQTTMMAIMVVGLILAIILSINIALGLTKPIKRLAKRVEGYNLDQENVKNKRIIKPKDEIYLLELAYEQMIDRIYNLMTKNIENLENQRKLELDSLQMQINPHFLYNTLDAIAWTAKIKKEPQIEHLVLSLAQFFRLTLHKGDKFITVGEEIELIQRYLDIEKFRFPDRFEVIFEVKEEIRKYQSLKLILQPVVENSIKHGLATTEYRGRINITVNKIDNDIIFVVSDDGVGFAPPPDILIKNEEKKLLKGGYGLINVNERIKLEYGEKYGLEIFSQPKVGTKVIIKIIARKV